MHRSVVAFLVLAGPALAAVAPACSSSGAPASSDAGRVGPNQPATAPCDPSLANPCLPAPPCYAVKCDEYAMICDETFVGCSGPGDGGFVFETSVADSAPATGGCTSNHDCVVALPDGAVPVVRVCAYSVFGGCQVNGNCVIPEPPHLPDGAIPTACGCAGEPVAYVNDTETEAPVMSNGPCESPVADAGRDAANDAAVDAAGDSDGGSDAAADGNQDATVDAPGDG
jgi:hypothetical protein